jgi:uncharacterized protein (TIGR02284 family)
MENSKQVTSETIDILNDLIQIHNDRLEGYEKAAKELRDADNDLRDLFNLMIQESHKMKSALVAEIQVLRGQPSTGTTAGGKIYSIWMDLKSMFSGYDRPSLLNNCESVEDATQKAYRQALESDYLPVFIRQILYDQRQSLKYSYKEIRELRDQYV